MKKLISAVLLIITVLSIIPLTACSGSEGEFDAVKKSGVLVIGITEYEPLTYYDENKNLVGFDAEYAKAVCELWGVEPEFKVISWEDKEDALNEGIVDCIWSGLSISPERETKMDFTDKYLTNYQCVVMKSKNQKKLTTSVSLSGGILTAQEDSMGEDIILSDVNLAKARLLSAESQKLALDNVAKSSAHAAFVDAVFAKGNLQKDAYRDLVIVESFVYDSENIGVGCRKDSDLVLEINKATETLREDGTMDALYTKYSLEEFTD